MDRRQALRQLAGKNSPMPAENALSTFAGLEPYAGKWVAREAAHLLRRTTFGPTKAEIEWARTQGLQAVLDRLFEDHPLPDPPVNHDETGDPRVDIGEIWLDAPYASGINLRKYRKESFKAWTIGLAIDQGISIREKLTLFWHNHFAITELFTKDPKVLYQYSKTLRSHAWGNFRELVKKITVDPGMLRFLNGNQNTKDAPNENYARELLELYTVGKGPLVAPGDYTNYTEDDVREIARVLTGWKERGHYTYNPDTRVESFFRENDHDTGDKTLSSRLGSVTISNRGDQEYAHLIDIIFQQPAAAKHICRKLYRWFVFHEIDDEVEREIIEPLAQQLIAEDFEIRPVLETLLSSAHFFHSQNLGPMIKSPMDFAVSAIRQLEVPLPDELAPRYHALYELYEQMSRMGMEYYKPPEVAGWKAWYQAPLYYRSWATSSTLQMRSEFTHDLLNGGIEVPEEDDVFLRAHPLVILNGMDAPQDPNHIVRGFADLLFPLPLTGTIDGQGSFLSGQYYGLKDVLIPGLPDFEWTIEYSDYLANPNDPDKEAVIDGKTRQLLTVMLSLVEFNLC